ncbi:MAG: hypothetical protein J6W23_03715, partial [Victivallales bacterium]|nr:hypothetical protein [Victivallales bacterium]
SGRAGAQPSRPTGRAGAQPSRPTGRAGAQPSRLLYNTPAVPKWSGGRAVLGIDQIAIRPARRRLSSWK